MEVGLSEQWQRFVTDEVRSGRFPSEVAVLEEALALLKRRESEPGPAGSQDDSGFKSIGEIIDQVMADLPVEALDRLPVDGAEQHHHFIYGTPKRPL
jgi:Arc/MetJ-type ribon-helix-helix transcriptional regulator